MARDYPEEGELEAADCNSFPVYSAIMPAADKHDAHGSQEVIHVRDSQGL